MKEPPLRVAQTIQNKKRQIGVYKLWRTRAELGGTIVYLTWEDFKRDAELG